MRFRLLLVISTALALAPVMACEFHAEAGSPPATPASTANPVTNPNAAAAAASASAPAAPTTPPPPKRVLATGSMHPQTTDGGTP